MKTKLFFFSLLVVFASCGNSADNTIKLDSTQAKAITSDSLNAEQIEKIKSIHTAFKEVYLVSLKELIETFKNDANPAEELIVWESMVSAYQKSLSDKPTTDLNTKKEIFLLVLLRSSMTETEVLTKIKLKILKEEEAKKVLSNYTLAPEPMDSVHVKDSIHK